MALHLAMFDAPTIIVTLIVVVLFVLLLIEAIKARGFSMNVLYCIAAIIVVAVVFFLLF